LTDKIRKLKIKSHTLSKLSADTTFNIPPISEDFIKKQLQALDTKKATGKFR